MHWSAWNIACSIVQLDVPIRQERITAVVYHGIGVKTVLFDPRLNAFDLRCVESQRVLDELVSRDPGARERLALVGFAKLDPLFADPLAPGARGLAGGDSGAPVLLYAPTFYPSSLELMPAELGALAPGARWIVKPHFFSLGGALETARWLLEAS